MSSRENNHDEKFIKERDEYEQVFFSQIIEDVDEIDGLDMLISEEVYDDFDFGPSPADLRLEEIYFAEYELKFRDEEDLDCMEDYDYPEGVDENLNGQIFKIRIP
ncbi:hypothetical protein [Methanobrevibacter sp. V14]|uniref:hypothetical protein n=1 Tax=Methanobrevibacter sp. V14 TaxID=3064280 RepID=UPI002732A026|nr:hypothetical protein [Methanobrevibacter sp. V14]